MIGTRSSCSATAVQASLSTLVSFPVTALWV